MTTQRQKSLLMLIVSLVLLKWLAMPALEQIEEKLATQALLNRSINKLEQLLEQEQQWRDVENKATEAKAKAFGDMALYDSPEAFQLAAQQQLEQIFTEYQLSSERFTWGAPVLALEQVGLYQQRATIQANGDTYQILALVAQLETKAPLYKNATMVMNIRQGERLGSANLTLGVDAFYLLREASQ